MARLLRSAVPVLLILLGCGGCSYRLDSMFSGAAAPEHTGSIRASAVPASADKLPPEDDLIYAKAAAKDILGKGRRDLSQAWENPRSGARGTVTPIAGSYEVAGHVCHDFLASYVREREESWMQGEACRVDGGQWQVRNLRPWQRS